MSNKVHQEHQASFQITAYLEINNDGYCATGSTMFGSVGSDQGTGYANPIMWNRWNHIAYTRDGSNVVRHYVNGRYIAKATVTEVLVHLLMHLD